jgi:hypothetical protein
MIGERITSGTALSEGSAVPIKDNKWPLQAPDSFETF